jgi:hypothetical protein
MSLYAVMNCAQALTKSDRFSPIIRLTPWHTPFIIASFTWI